MSKRWLDLTEEQRLWTIRHDNLNIANSPEEVTCPWCDQKQGYSYEDLSFEDDANEEKECYECEKKFDVRTVVTYDWRTELPEEYLIEKALKEMP